MNLPQDFIKEMTALLGKEEIEPFLGSFSLPHEKGFRINTQKPCNTDLSKYGCAPVPFWQNAYYTQEEGLGISPLHHAGAYYMQEPSAMFPASVLAPKKGSRVLDLCAAPGGKSGQLASIIGDEGLLVANEINTARSRVLLGNVERLGLKNTVVTNLSPTELCKHAQGWFDYVLVDAPCSGEGMFRKNPDAVAEWSSASVEACAQRQLDILNCGAKCVREGGMLVYSTCTFSYAEDEGVIEKFLSQGGFELIDIPKAYGIQQGLDSKGYCARLYPHKFKGEGHFAALMRKTASEQSCKIKNALRCLSKKEEALCLVFTKNCLSKLPSLAVYNSNIVVPPLQLPPLPFGIIGFGVKMGELTDRLIPHHQFFSAYYDYFTRKIELCLDDPRVMAYIGGEEIKSDIGGGNGWGVLSVEGCALGGVKITEDRAKNLYPKGLRKKL